MQSIDAVIFDLFGTLVFLEQQTQPYFRLFAEAGCITPQQLKAARNVCLTENLPLMALVAKRLWPTRVIDTTTYDAEIACEIASAKLYPETLTVLNVLKEKKLKLGLISNIATPYKQVFYNNGLEHYFPHPVFSCDAGLVKPDIQVYAQTLQNLGTLPERTLMVGDKVRNDVEAPLSTGMQARLIDRERKTTSSYRINALQDILSLL